MSKVDKRGDDECWEWKASKSSFGYGKFSYAGSMRVAHRFIWIHSNGPIPSGLLVCHKCDNPGCVNPRHLFLGTSFDNTHDCMNKGRFPTGTRRKPRDFCPSGHPYSGDNVYVTPSGERKCRTCTSNNNRLRYQRMKKEGASG
jgi:hypothetical protein